MADHAHVVIAKLASYGTSEQQVWAADVREMHASMQSYVLERWPDHASTKVNPSKDVQE
jgi:hypothetical protein